MKRPIIVAHGIYGHGGRGPDLVIPELRKLGYQPIDYNYRFTAATTAGIRALVVKRAVDLAIFAEKLHARYGVLPDYFGHSFGVQLGFRAAWHAAQVPLFRNAFMFHGAARRGFSWPVGLNQAIQRAYLFNYRHDRALKLTLPLRILQPWNQMGQLGRLGYAGPPNPAISQYDLPLRAKLVENTHSAWFNEGWPKAAEVIGKANV